MGAIIHSQLWSNVRAKRYVKEVVNQRIEKCMYVSVIGHESRELSADVMPESTTSNNSVIWQSS